MILTPEELNILAHVVVDPLAWADHAAATVGEYAVREKIEKYRAEYTEQSALPDYKNRSQRDAEL